MLTAADAAAQRSLISVYSTAEVDAIIGGLTFLTSSQIDTLAEINAILGDADLVAQARTITAGTGLSGGGDLSADRTINLANTAVTAGSYTSANITVDAQGRITSAANGSSATPGGSTGQVQFNNAGSFGGAAAVVYAATGTHLAVTATGATIIPFCVKGAASQSANLQEWQNSAGTILSRIDAAGQVFAPLFSSNATTLPTRFTPIEGLRKGWAFDNGQQGQFMVSTNTFDGTGNCVSIGTTALQYNEDGANHRLLIDCANRIIFVGGGRNLTSPQNGSVSGSNGSGTNIAAAKLTLHGGRSTGSATPSIVSLAATTAGASGTTLQTLRDVLQCDGNTTSGETPMLLLDCAKGTLQRVSIGAADSGGTGFKVLRVPN
jgi:hypothetical protein